MKTSEIALIGGAAVAAVVAALVLMPAPSAAETPSNVRKYAEKLMQQSGLDQFGGSAYTYNGTTPVVYLQPGQSPTLPPAGTSSSPILYVSPNGSIGGYGGYDTTYVVPPVGSNGTYSLPWAYGTWHGAGWYLDVPGTSTNTPVRIPTEQAYYEVAGKTMPNTAGTSTNPYQVWQGWQGAGYYIWPAYGNTIEYASTQAALKQYNDTITGTAPSPYTGTQSNPYPFTSWQGSGYYKVPTSSTTTENYDITSQGEFNTIAWDITTTGSP